MPEKETTERAREEERESKSPSTQAGEFVREEIEHIREGKHGARSTKQAIAIGLSKARRAGVKLPPPKKGAAAKGTRRKAKRDLKKGGEAWGQSNFARALAHHDESAQARGPLRSFKKSALQARSLRRPETHQRPALGCGAESCSDPSEEIGSPVS